MRGEIARARLGGAMRACRSFPAFVIVSLLALAFSACGSSSGGSIDDAGGVSGSDAGGISAGAAPLDESVRLAALTDSEAVYRASSGKPKAARDAALVAF